jgi:hypothetical protein
MKCHFKQSGIVHLDVRSSHSRSAENTVVPLTDLKKKELEKWTEETYLKGVVPKPKLNSIQLIFLPWVLSRPELKEVKQSASAWYMVNQGAPTHFQVWVLLFKRICMCVYVCV